MFEPTVFDYVTMDDDNQGEEELDKFLETKVGKIFDSDDYHETAVNKSGNRNKPSAVKTANLFVPSHNISQPNLKTNNVKQESIS